MNKTRKPIRGWLRVVIFIIPFFIFVGISQFLAGLVLGIKLPLKHFTPTTFQSTVFTLFMLMGSIAVVAIFRKWIDRESFKSLGFGLKNVSRELIIGFLMGVVLITLGFVILLGIHEISFVGTNLNAVNLLLSIVLFVAVGINEELLFRGYILGNFMLSMNRWVALLVSSVVFSLLHMGNANFDWFSFLCILLAGILLGLPYIYTKSLWLPIAFHFSWNFFQGTIYGFNVSGNTEYNLIQQSRVSDTLLNGGKFGFEGSILAVIFLTLTIIGLWIYFDRKEKGVAVNEIAADETISI
jgi:hypothetical protein